MCGFMNQYLKKAEASAVSAALLSLWITVCVEGSKSPSFANLQTFLNNHIPRFPNVGIYMPRAIIKHLQGRVLELWLFHFSFTFGESLPNNLRFGDHLVCLSNFIKNFNRGGFETIPLDSNNLGEFLGCLAGLQQVIGFEQHVEMVGNYKILTEAVPKMKPINNFELNEILSEIRDIAESKFAKVKYTHVYCEFNKRSDAIATAASHSEEDGMEAVFDRNWDLRTKQLTTISEEWIIENSKLWK